MKKYCNDLNDVFTRFYIVVRKFEFFFQKTLILDQRLPAGMYVYD